jgi:hypothetical protein
MVHLMGFTPEYVESISPSERGIFKSYYMREMKAKEADANKSALNDVGLTIGDIM